MKIDIIHKYSGDKLIDFEFTEEEYLMYLKDFTIEFHGLYGYYGKFHLKFLEIFKLSNKYPHFSHINIDFEKVLADMLNEIRKEKLKNILE